MGVYRFIMNYEDHLTKFTIIRLLKSKTSEEVAYQLMGIFCMFGAPFILHSDNGREFANKIITKYVWYVARNEARAWKAETFSKSRISWKIQPRCSRHAGCLDVRQQHENLVWRTTVYPKQEKPSSAFRHQDNHNALWLFLKCTTRCSCLKNTQKHDISRCSSFSNATTRCGHFFRPMSVFDLWA